MGQHFLLSAKARTLSVVEVARMSDADAEAAFRAVRFADNGGEPFCPRCGVDAVYAYKCRPEFKCKACDKRFSLTSGTIFADRKLSYRDILTAIALFVNGANGYPALRFGRDLNVSYKTAWVLLHKLRETMGAIQHATPLTGEVEIDGVWIGGKVRKLNLVEDRKKLAIELRKQRRAAKLLDFPLDTDPEKRVCIVTFRERRRGGRSRSFVFKREHLAVQIVGDTVDPKAELITDGGSHWGQLELVYDRKEVPHSVGFMVDGVHINGVESFHSRIRRGERGVYLRIVGPHLQNYADEFSWRDDHRRVSNGQQYRGVLSAVAKQPTSKTYVGRWQRRKPPEAQAA